MSRPTANMPDPSTSAEFSPLVEELPAGVSAVDAFVRLASRPHCLFFDSALEDAELGRYSFVTADPFDLLVVGQGGDAFGELRGRMAGLASADVPELPPFQGGIAGLFGYDLARRLERIPPNRHDEFEVPPLAVGFYDVVVAFDHAQERGWIISQGLPETDRGRRQERAAERLRTFRRWITADAPVRPPNSSENPIPASELAAVAADRMPGLLSNFDRAAYLEVVRQAIEYIHAGDIFQVNLSQRLLYPQREDPVSLYLRLRKRNPATFAGYFDLGMFQICSASPERFLQVRGREVETRPIKGTRHRAGRPEADLFGGDELRASAKDRAENVMIVDLLRNDISRVCTPQSVRVTQLCEVENYQYVQHLVSCVRGTLADGSAPLDLLQAAFPGGSITGAPKPRAMEIIAELEPTARGPYCGSLGYLGFDGSFDTSILIRTMTCGRGWWQFPVGGGIVADSDPELEYAETWHKAEGLLRALP